jgi:1,4-dihydroxy-2-naphthoate octaprenyltransferase
MAGSPIIKSLDYFFVLRPMLFVPGWSAVLAGYFISSKKELYYTPHVFLNLDYLQISILLILFSAAMGATFLLNQLKDIDSDLKNKKLFILSENHITKKSAINETLILILLSLILALNFSSWFFLAVVLFIILTGFMYNYKPFRFKDRPLGSAFANTLMAVLAFAIGWLAVNDIGYGLIIDSLPYVFFNTALYFFTTLPDIAGDKDSNKRTLAVLYGIDVVIILAEVCYLAGFISAIILKDYFALAFIVCSFPFFVNVLINRRVKNTIKTTKYAILFFAAALWLKIPFYFPLLIAIFIFTKWYFARRFHFDYPNFKGE